MFLCSKLGLQRTKEYLVHEHCGRLKEMESGDRRLMHGEMLVFLDKVSMMMYVGLRASVEVGACG